MGQSGVGTSLPQERMPNSGKRIAILNPYDQQGGAGQYQESLRWLLNAAANGAQFKYCDVFVAGQSGRLGRYWSYIRMMGRAMKLWSVVREANVVVIQGHFNPASWVFAGFCRAWNVKYILIPHGDFVPTWGNARLYKSTVLKIICWALMGRIVVKNAAGVVVGSKTEEGRYIEYVGAKERIRVIPNLIVPESDTADKVDLEWKAPFALWLGRISKEKGLELLVETWRLLGERQCVINLKIVGRMEDEHLLAELKKKIEKYGLCERVEFLNWVGGEEKRRLIRQSRCVLLPSIYESFGRVVPEAVMLRTPVIAADSTPWSGIESVGGFWLARDPNVWADRIQDLAMAEEKRVLDLRRCDEFMRRFGYEELSGKWMALFRDLGLGG